MVVALAVGPVGLAVVAACGAGLGAGAGWLLATRRRAGRARTEAPTPAGATAAVAATASAPAPTPTGSAPAASGPAAGIAVTVTEPGLRPAGVGPELVAEDSQLDRALGALPLGVVVADSRGWIVYRNDYAAQFATGRHGDVLVEAAIEEAASAALAGHPVERPIDLYGPPARNLLVRAIPTWAPGPGPTRRPTPAGASPPEGPAPGLTGTVVLVEDVTVAHQVERLRKDFVANVSHELRTPVGAIGVLAETLRDADDPAIVDRLAGRLHNEALRLGVLIEDLLALSRLESGRIEHPELVDLCQVVRLAVERSNPAAEQRDVAVDITVDLPKAAGDAAPMLVEGDQSQLVSAVANLLDNAIKYSDPGSRVSLDLTVEGAVVPGVVTEGAIDGAGGEAVAGEAVLSVVDTGVGIPEAAQSRIFERFYRVDVARSRATGGTGLGLSIVRHAVINHQGTISVSSVEGMGSTFTIRLPLAVPPMSPNPIPTPNPTLHR